MAQLCPNENLPEWKELLKAFNNQKGKALTAFRLYNKKNNTVDDIPSVEEAFEIYSELKGEEKDEQFVLSSEEFKLLRIDTQIQMLETLKEDANPEQAAALSKIIRMSKAYKNNFLQKNIEKIKKGEIPEKSVSVSAYIGAANFTGDPLKYEAFKHFGTFMHDLIERAQLESLSAKVPIYQVLNYKFFEETLKNYRKISPFEIEDLTDEAMFEMANSIIQHIGTNITKGFLLVPEVTVTGLTTSGTRVVGRMDMIMLDVTGAVSILDFKTKKLHKMFSPDASGELNRNYENTFIELAQPQYAAVDKEGTNPGLRGGTSATGGTKRSTFDNWTLQLKVYENLMRQNGIDVQDKAIVAMLYQTDEDQKFVGSDLIELNSDTLYLNAVNQHQVQNPSKGNKDATWIPYILNYKTRVADYIKVINEDIHYPGMEQEEDEVVRISKHLEISDEQNAQILKNIKSLINSNKENVNRELANLKDDPINARLRETLLKRKESLERLEKDILNAPPDTDLRASINFSQSIQIISDEIELLHKRALENQELFQLDKSEKNILLASKIAHQTKAYFDMLQVAKTIIRSHINELAELEKRTLTPSEQAQKASVSYIDDQLNEIQDKIREIDAATRSVTLGSLIKVLMNLDGVSLERMNEQARQAHEAHLTVLNNKINNILKTKKDQLPFFSRTADRLLSFVSKDYKQKLIDKTNDPEFTHLEDLIKKRDYIQTQLEIGVELKPEYFEKYIEGITDPQSTTYIGSNNLWGTNTGMRDALTFDKLIASATNSEMVVSAMTLMLKNAEGEAREKTIADFVETAFDHHRERALKKHSFEDINEKISEWREVEFINPETGERETKRALNLVIPYSDEYAKAFKNYKLSLIEIRKEIDNIKNEYWNYYNAITDEGVAKKNELKQTLQAAQSKKEALYKEYLNWMLENCSLPYVDKFYELQTLLPDDIREKMQDIYFEIDAIMHLVGRGEDDVLYEQYPDDYDRMQQLKYEIKKLKEEARERNPKYAEYLSTIDELYEYVPQDDVYQKAKKEAMIRFAGDKEAMDTWMSLNSVSRPKQEWYDALDKIYQGFAEIFGTNSSIQELIDERTKIRRPYKVDGIMQTRYLTDEDAERLSQIDDEISLIKENTKQKLSKADAKKVRKLTQQLEAIQSTYENVNYVKTRKDKTLLLKKRLAEKRRFINMYETAVATGQPQERIQVLKVLLLDAERNFANEENDFAAWYNKNHENTYISIENQWDPIGMAKPKKFNYDKLPAKSVWTKYMDIETPASKYTIRKLKDSARNPNFIKSPDGTPMPKGFLKDGDGVYLIDMNVAKPENINTKYLNLIKEPEVFNYYKSLTNLYFKLQKDVEGKTLGYGLPGYAASTIENFSKLGFKDAMKKTWEIYKDKQFNYSKSQDDILNNVYGDTGSILRNKHSLQLDENMQSVDVAGAVLRWSMEANMNIAMQKVQPQTEAAIQHLISLRDDLNRKIQTGQTYDIDDSGKKIPTDYAKRLKNLNTIIEVLEFERNKFIYGQTETSENRTTKKIFNQIAGIVSFARIGFDITNQAKNFIAGSLQTFIASGKMDSAHYTQDDLMQAWSDTIRPNNGMIAKYWKDYNNISDLSKETLLYRTLNPAQKDQEKYIRNNTGSLGRKLAEKINPLEWSHMIQDKGDTAIAFLTMRAILNHAKFPKLKDDDSGDFEVNDKGEVVMVSAYDALYKTSVGTLGIRPDVQMTKQDFARLRNIVYSEIRRAQGNYAKSDMTPFETGVLGKAAMFYRKYLVPTVLNKFGYTRPDYESGSVAMGYWNAVYLSAKAFGPRETAKHLFLGAFTDLNKYEGRIFGGKLNPYFTNKLKHASRDLYAHILFTTLSMMIYSYLRNLTDDEEEKIGMLQWNVIRLALLTERELTSMTPIIGGGNDEYIRNFTTVTTYTRELTAVGDLLSHSFNYGFVMITNGGEEADPEKHSEIYVNAYKNAFYMRKSGPYEEGDAKIMKDFYDFTGIKNIRDIFEPENRIEQLKRNR